MGAGADPAEIVQQIARRGSCARCGTPHDVVALHGSGYGDSYAAGCLWCLPTSYRPLRVVALRYDDGWHVDAALAPRLPGDGAVRGDLDRSTLAREWARRWLDAAQARIRVDPDAVGPLERFDLETARRLVARDLHLDASR